MQLCHYDDVIMTMLASQITSLMVVYSIVYSGVNQKKTSNIRVTGLCAGNSPGTGEFPAQMASYAENVSIWWRHHGTFMKLFFWPLNGLSKQISPGTTVCVIISGVVKWKNYSISQEICTWFCCALLCCGYAIIHNEFTWSICPYSSGLLYWHWGNR